MPKKLSDQECQSSQYSLPELPSSGEPTGSISQQQNLELSHQEYLVLHRFSVYKED